MRRDQLEWRGRFPQNDIISLLDVNRTFNLAESTAQDLTLGEILDMAPLEQIRALKLGYGSSAGNPALRAAIAQCTGVTADEVITTQGTALGLFLLAFELCRPGDDVMLVTPCFPPSRDSLIGNGVQVIDIPLTFEDRFQIDLARIAGSLSVRTKLVSLASPQNPSGVATSPAKIKALLDEMARRAPDAMLFVDETYREAVYGNAPTPASVAPLDPRIITGSSVSKALGAPGLRTGWLTVRDPGLRARLTTAKMNIVISGSVLDEAFAEILLTRRNEVLAARRTLLATALGELEQWCEGERARIDWIKPDGGALCCMRLRHSAFDDDAIDRFWTLPPAYDLQLARGDWFGGDPRLFRLGFGYLPAKHFTTALHALSRAMDAASSH